MVDRTAGGRTFRILTIIDEYTRECLGILVGRRITSQDVINKLFQLFVSGEYQNIFAPIMELNSLPGRYAPG
jgi:transposase InsO family protein